MDKSFNPFDPEAMMKMMQQMPFADMMPKMPGFDPAALNDMQSRNMEAFQAANSAASAAYKDLFAKQVELMKTMMSEAKANADAARDPAKAQEVMTAGVQKAMDLSTELAGEAQKANARAWEIVSARMRDSISELEEMAKPK
ncbi:hypothetical protein SAMN06273572_103202 [Monaibacterium marinum]|uniref:Uncharacterized protein n=1 Tax=Pontivivens marinum TaxID=1690039 RepID=A0A2C9CSH4_9RHOB|nr:phasin family protein [Monaibacterium marinum]SOH94173.1 hypothetical protein SAMN06273572_103202 [Monaibacterium marinum]